MKCIEQLAIKHTLAIELVKIFAQRKGLSPDEIVSMAFHTAELVSQCVIDEVENLKEECQCNENKEHAKHEELGKIIRRFIDEGHL